MEPVVEVAEVYRKEFEETFEGLRQRGQTLQESSGRLLEETQAQIEPTKQEAISVLTDTSDIEAPVRPVVETFGWASVLILAASIGSLMGAYVLGPVVGLFVGGFGAAIAAFVALPVYAYYFGKKAEAENTSDVSVRFTLLAVAFGMGVLSGFLFAGLDLSGQPIALITPLVLAVAFPTIAQSVGGSRVNLLGASLGAALGLNLVLGLVSGYLTAPYFLLAVLYAASAGVTLQLVFKNVQTPEQRVHLYQLFLLTSFVVVKAVVFGLCGSAEKPESAPTSEEKK